MAKLEIVPVETGKDLKQFIMLPWKIYRNDPCWVPPLIMDMKKLLDRRKNPFFQHSEAEYFLARKDGEVVGRIAAILNNNHNAFHNERTGFFGFFECIENAEVAGALLSTAEAWVRERNQDRIRGPMNFSTNDTCGLLIEGFDTPPFILMPHNPPYYQQLLENAGYTKVQDMFAYRMYEEQGINPRIHKIAQIAREREGVRVRKLNMKRFWEELETVKKIYNDAWSKNWGFVPLTEAEIEHLARELKPVIDPDMVLFAEIEGEAVAFSLSLPDYNQALIKINGRLFPFGIFKLLYYARKINAVRVFTLGVMQKYQKSRGIGPLLYEETFLRGTRKGYTWGEFSWILESNKLMNSALKLLGAEIYKRYRIFEKPLL